MTRIGRVLRWAASGQLPKHFAAWRRLRRDARLIAASALFDAAWYRDVYPDVAGDPALHYLRCGAAEGRRPSPGFDGEAYCRLHPEVTVSDENPLLHCLKRNAGSHPHAFAPIGAPSSLPPSLPPLLMARLPLTDETYRRWLAACGHGSAAVRPLASGPRFGIVLPGPDGPDPATVASVKAQTYSRWQWGEAADYVLFLAPRARLAPHALASFAEAIAVQPAAELLYADEDRVDAAGLHCDPWFKPEWDPEQGGALVGSAGVYARTLLDRVAKGADGDMAADLAHRAVAATARIRHLPDVLVHVAGSASDPIVAPPLASLATPPLVSVIVPARDRAALLARCAQGVLHGTDYPAIELLVLDNGSRTAGMRRLLRRLSQDIRVRVLDAPGAFNWSALNNAGVRAARGELVVLLNSDTEVADPGWLRRLVVRALQPGVGAVGAKLVYPDGTVQHAGISLGPGARAGHLMRHAQANDPAHRGLLARTRSVAAVTGACMALRRSLFLAVGGLDEALPVTGSDIELCLRLRSLGCRVVWCADAVLVHHESATRGLDASDAARTRIAAERRHLLRRWGALAERDPYLSRNLTVVGERLALASPATATTLLPPALEPVMAA